GADPAAGRAVPVAALRPRLRSVGVDEPALGGVAAVLIEEQDLVLAFGVEPGRGDVVERLRRDGFAVAGGDEVAADVAAVDVELALGQAGGVEEERRGAARLEGR